MEGESDWDDLPEWVSDFLDKNELTELVWAYLKKRVPYDTFKNWTFEELRAIKFSRNRQEQHSSIIDEVMRNEG